MQEGRKEEEEDGHCEGELGRKRVMKEDEWRTT